MRIIKRLIFGGAPAALALVLAGTASAQDAGGQSVSANQPKPVTPAAKTIRATFISRERLGSAPSIWTAVRTRNGAQMRKY